MPSPNQTVRKLTDSAALTPADNAAPASIKNSPLRRLRLQLGFFARQRTIERWRVSEFNKLMEPSKKSNKEPSGKLMDNLSQEKTTKRNKIGDAAERLNACLLANLNEPNSINATRLDLGGLDLDEIPNIFGGCPNLKTLIASGNNFVNKKQYPKSLLALKSCEIIKKPEASTATDKINGQSKPEASTATDKINGQFDDSETPTNLNALPHVWDKAMILENYQHIEEVKVNPLPFIYPTGAFSQKPTTIQQSAKVITQGLPNLGKTCYANAAIKYLASSYGTDLLAHLQNLLRECPDNGDATVRKAFDRLNITIRSLIKGNPAIVNDPIKHMNNLFTALNELFKKKKINFEILQGNQQDAHELIRALNEAFALDTITSTKISSTTIIKSKDTGQIIRKTQHELNTIHIPLANAHNNSSEQFSFKELFSQFNKPDDIGDYNHNGKSTPATKSQSIVTDVNEIKKIKTTIAPYDFNDNLIKFKDINYDTKFKQIVTDEKTEKEYELTLQADSIIGFYGSIKQESGHYVAFNRNEGAGADTWSIHDDDKVTNSATLSDAHEKSENFQPTTITFKVIKKTPVSLNPD